MEKLSIVPEVYWGLPGPRHFITRIEVTAANSRLIWINLPYQSPPGTWEGIQKGLKNGHIDRIINLRISSGTDISAEIGVHFDRKHLSAAELIALQADRRAAVILMPDGPDSAPNIERFGNEFLRAIGKGEGNVHLVLGVHEESLVSDAREGGVQVITFDGGLSPDEMDAYIAIRMLSRPGPGSTRLTRAIVSEFAGFDVELAERIMQLSETQIVNIITNLPQLMTDTPLRWRHDSWLTRTRSSAAHAATHTLNDVHLADHGPVEGREAANNRLKRRYWRACVKTLTPWLEERRVAVIRKFDRQIRAEAALHNGKIAKPIERRVIYIDPDELEYNNIVGMCHAGKISATTTEESCAENVCRLAKAVRDEIAHMRMPHLNDIDRLIREMDRLLISTPISADI
jgi:hypothetical protein